jgi:hypothetical protein
MRRCANVDVGEVVVGEQHERPSSAAMPRAVARMW